MSLLHFYIGGYLVEIHFQIPGHPHGRGPLIDSQLQHPAEEGREHAGSQPAQTASGEIALLFAWECTDALHLTAAYQLLLCIKKKINHCRKSTARL